MLADKLKKPLLMIHGEEDNNSGTLTMQVYLLILFFYLGVEELHHVREFLSPLQY